MSYGLTFNVSPDQASVNGVPMRTVLIDALKGIGASRYFGSLHMAEYTGDQHNETWEWDLAVLEQHTTNQLAELYSKRRGEVSVE